MPRRKIEGGESKEIDRIKENKKRKKKRKTTEDKFYDYSYENGLAGEASDMDPIPNVGTEYERYNPFNENEWIEAKAEAQSTFSIEVRSTTAPSVRALIAVNTFLSLGKKYWRIDCGAAFWGSW